MTRPARVLLVSENLPLARDHRLRKQVQSLVRSGFGVTVVCRRDPENAVSAGVRLRQYRAPEDATSKLGYLREYAWSLAMATWHVTRALCSEGFDAIQIASTPDIYFPLAIGLRLLGKQVVFDARDLSPEIYARRYEGGSKTMLGLLRALELLSYRSANAVLAVNESVAAVATDRCRVARGRVTIVGNGPILSDLEAPQSSGPGRYPNELVCCFVGFIGPQDSVDLALRAVALLAADRSRPPTKFLFVGEGDALPALRRLAHALEIDDLVSFQGWAPPDEVAVILSHADVGLEPNLEPFVTPVKVMEYMAYGLPVVAFDLTETRRLVGPAGLYANPGDISGFARCVASLLEDAATRRRLGEEGKQRVKTSFAWEHQEERYVRLYKRLLGSVDLGDAQSKAGEQ